MRTYRGKRTARGAVVTVDGRSLARCLNLFNHSPGGFEWGYGGSGPAQLALAILADHLGRDGHDLAIKLHQRFKFSVVAGLPHDGWTLTGDDVAAAIQRLSADGAAS